MIIKLKLDLKNAEEILKGIDDEFIKKFISTKTINLPKKKRNIKICDVISNDEHWLEKGSYSIKEFYNSDIIIDTPTSIWPKVSDLCCWYCSRPIETTPIGLPYKKEIVQNISSSQSSQSTSSTQSTSTIQSTTQQEVYHTAGAFCTFSCAYTWNLSSENILFENKYNQEALLYELFIKVGGKGKICKAPPRIYLLKYGGIYTNDEYSRLFNKNNIIMTSSMPPLRSSCHNIDITVLDDIDHNKSKYKLYRKKPLYKSIDHNFQ